MMREFIASFQYSSYGMLCVAAGIFNITLGLMVLAKDPKSSVNRSFFYFSGSAFLWIFGYGLMSLMKQDNAAFFWFRCAFLGVPFISQSVFVFSERLRGRERNGPPVLFGFFLAVLFTIIGVYLTEYVCEIRLYYWGRFNYFKDTPFGNAYFYSLITTFFTYLLLAAVNFYRTWKDAPNPAKRLQARNISVAFLVSYIGTTDFLATKGIIFYPIGYVALTGLIGAIAYTIVRHQFFNVNAVLKRVFLMTSIYSFLLAFTLPLSIIFLKKFLHGFSLVDFSIIISFGLILGLVLSTGPFIYAYLIRNSVWLRDHFSTGLVHELKSPLSSIQSALDIIRDQLGNPKKNKQSMDYIDMIEKNVSRLDTYVGDLLAIAKAQEETIRLEKEPLTMGGLVQGIIEAMKPLAKQKGLTISENIDHRIHVDVDKKKVSQIVSNLLSNAIKFSDQGTITVELKKSDNQIICSVSDEGRGIDPRHLNKIFDRFYQASPNTKGSGIGLAIAKAWVEAHGGKIWAESPCAEASGDRKAGTKMVFTVPA